MSFTSFSNEVKVRGAVAGRKEGGIGELVGNSFVVKSEKLPQLLMHRKA